MAPQLGGSQHDLIDAMIKQNLPTYTIAKTADCSERTVRRIRSKQCSTPTKMPRGRRRLITPYMEEILRDQLIDNSAMFRCEIADFLYEKTGIEISPSSISRSLHAMGWSRKVARRVAKQRNYELRDLYLHRLSEFETNQLIFIDESGCDKKAGQRRWGWAPRGSAPVQINAFNRDQRFQILPAYTVEGVLLARVYLGSTDSDFFEDFIEQLLQHCGRYPEPRSVLVMDNASFHSAERLKELCDDAGVRLLFLPPYSPDLNPIEEFFAELKHFIKKNWNDYEGLIRDDFKEFLRHCVEVVGQNKKSARGHFRHAGLSVEEPYEE